MKITLVTIIAIIVVSGVVGDNFSFAQQYYGCGDNVCDEFEQVNQNACPQDCPFEIITTNIEITSPNFFEKIFDNAIDYSREYFPFTFFAALIFSLWIGFSIIKRKLSIFWSFFIPILVYGGLIVYTAWGDDFGLAGFFAFITACIALFINYCILIVYLLLKPGRRVYMKKILLIMAIASFIFLIFSVRSLLL